MRYKMVSGIWMWKLTDVSSDIASQEKQFSWVDKLLLFWGRVKILIRSIRARRCSEDKRLQVWKAADSVFQASSQRQAIW